jgi:membrane-associated phospholipid phosphatase
MFAQIALHAPSVKAWLLPSRTLKRRLWPPLVGVGYIAAIAMLGGLRADHVLIGLLGLLDLYNEKTRAFLREFLPFILTGVIFDGMRYFYWLGVTGRVHVEGPYKFDLHTFGVGGRTLNEWFALHHCAFLDLLCGFAYLVFFSEYLLLAGLLFLREQYRPLRAMAWTFLIVNLLGFATYFVFPVAPPWYVAQYGFGPARLDVGPSPAAGVRFDALLHVHWFQELYGRGVDVYGAYPSLHVAYPFIVAITVFRQRDLKWARVPALAFFFLMCFSAVYLQHHYVTDVLLGLTYALVTLTLVSQRRPARAPSLQLSASGSRLPAALAASASARE